VKKRCDIPHKVVIRKWVAPDDSISPRADHRVLATSCPTAPEKPGASQTTFGADLLRFKIGQHRCAPRQLGCACGIGPGGHRATLRHQQTFLRRLLPTAPFPRRVGRAEAVEAHLRTERGSHDGSVAAVGCFFLSLTSSSHWETSGPRQRAEAIQGPYKGPTYRLAEA
jgi:hypothetical protein